MAAPAETVHCPSTRATVESRARRRASRRTGCCRRARRCRTGRSTDRAGSRCARAPSGLDQVEEGVDAAALRAVRVAHAVDEDVDLVAGQPAHEDAGHRRAGPLELDAGPPSTAWATTVLDADGDLRRRDDVHRLAGVPQQVDVLARWRLTVTSSSSAPTSSTTDTGGPSVDPTVTTCRDSPKAAARAIRR